MDRLTLHSLSLLSSSHPTGRSVVCLAPRVFAGFERLYGTRSGVCGTVCPPLSSLRLELSIRSCRNNGSADTSTDLSQEFDGSELVICVGDASRIRLNVS